MSTVQKIDISSSTILRIALLLVACWFLYIVRDLLLMLVAAIVISSAIEPVADKLQRNYKVPRAISVLGIYLVFIGVLVAVVTLIVPALIQQTIELSQALPQLVDVFHKWFADSPQIFGQDIVTKVQDGLAQFGNQIANLGVGIFQQTRIVVTGLLSVLFVFIIAFYLVIEEKALLKFFRHVVPRAHISYVENVIERLQYKIGRWFLGQLALALAIGCISTIGLWILGVKYALALGLLAGVMEVIPVIGPIFAAVPAVFVGLSQSWLLGVGVLIFYIVLQQVENNVLVPNIMKKATGLNPLVTLLAVLLGARLAGLPGVILSVPVATILSIVFSDFFSTDTPSK